jgi:hypothetical protein
MRFLIPLFCILLTGCQSAQPVHTHGMDLSVSERTELERKAASGDAAAAWQLYHYYSFEHHDETAADPWLRRTAELDHPQAQRSLAYFIKDYKHSPKGFGATAPAAVKYLLERSARTEGNACNELAAAYAEGYFGAPDHTKARFYFERGAGFSHRACWEKLSHYYRHGLGGPRNNAAAYYWISLEARCVDPRSISGQETWTAREEIATHLSLPALEHEWKRIDAFMADVAAKKVTVDFAAFLSGMINPKLEAEGRRLSQQREDEHRKKLKSKNA